MARPPTASRPETQPGYFVGPEEGSGLLDWSDAVARLVAARNYWVATVSPTGVPHSMPVWGVWLDGRFLFSTGPATRKARNLRTNANVVVTLESAAQVVIVEGTARERQDPDLAADFVTAYNPKYGWNFTQADLADGGLFDVEPRKAFAWLGDEGDAFNGTGTRWIFEPRPSQAEAAPTE